MKRYREKRLKSIWAVLLSLLLSFTACNFFPAAAVRADGGKTIPIYIKKGDSLDYKSDNAGSSSKWKSDNTSVATLIKDTGTIATIKGMGVGDAKISLDGLAIPLEVRVREFGIKSGQVDQTLAVGDTLDLTQFVDYNGANGSNLKDYSGSALYSSKDTEKLGWTINPALKGILDLDPETGIITAKKEGDVDVNVALTNAAVPDDGDPYDYSILMGFQLNATFHIHVKAATTATTTATTATTATTTATTATTTATTATTASTGKPITTTAATASTGKPVTTTTAQPAGTTAKPVGTTTARPVSTTAKPAKIKLNKESIKKITAGARVALKVKGVKKPKWTSSRKKIATVDKNGVVKTKKAGTVKITAKVGNSTAVCTIKVVKLKRKKSSRRWIRVNWRRVYDAKGYYVYMNKNGGAYKKVKNVKGNKYGSTVVMVSGKHLRFKVKPYGSIYGKYSYKAKKTELNKVVIYTFSNIYGYSYVKGYMRHANPPKKAEKAKWKYYKKQKTTSKHSITYKQNGGAVVGDSYRGRIKAVQTVNGKKYTITYKRK